MVVAAANLLGRSVELDQCFWAKDDQYRLPWNVLGYGEPLDFYISNAAGSGMGKRRHAEDDVSDCCVAIALGTDVDEPEEDDDNEDDECAEDDTEAKTSKTLSKAFAELIAQVHDSMLHDKETMRRRADDEQAKVVVNRRYAVLTTGEQYYFFVVKWESGEKVPSVTFLGKTSLTIFRNANALPAAGHSPELLPKMEESDFRKCVAALVLCTKDKLGDV